MRNHGWQPPFHPLQTVAIAVFCTLAFSFYVFFAPFLGTRTLKFVIIAVFTPLVSAVCFLYIACTWIDPADPGVRRSHEKYNPKKEAETGLRREEETGLRREEETGLRREEETGLRREEETGLRREEETGLRREEETGRPPAGRDEGEPKSIQSHVETRNNAPPAEDTGCKPLERCKRQRQPEELDLDLYCSICDADISAYSKHCRTCDKCVHGFDHHCRWLNNCVGTRNYKPFVALMVSCLLMLILEWAVGIVVLVRCFSDKTSFDQEISDKLGRSFPRVAFILVLMILTFLAFLTTAPLTQLFCFHLILMHKGITTYDYILAVREVNQEFWEENAGGTSSQTTSPALSTETGFSGYNSSAASKRIVFCTPPRMFVDQDQTVMALSDLEVGARKAGAGKRIDAASKPKPRPPGQVGLNPWKLARVTTEDATRAAARARAKSSILHPNRPPGTELPASVTDTESSNSFQSSASGEIRPAGSRSRRKRNVPGLPREIMWSKSNKQDHRISPLGGTEGSEAAAVTFPNPNSSSLEGLPPEPRSPYRYDAYSGDPRASYPAPQGPFPPQILFPRFPGDAGMSTDSPHVQSTLVGRPPLVPGTRLSVTSSSADVARISVNSDGYEASCGESGDDTSDAVGLSQSWNKPTWSQFAGDPRSSYPDYKEEDVKPWVATFPAGSSSMPDVAASPGSGVSVLSSGSRVEANILKVNPELRDARNLQSSSSPTVYEESPLRESSDFLSEDTTTSYGETQDRSIMSSFFYTGPESVTFKATSERQGVSNRMLVIGARSGLSRVTDDPKLLVETP